MGNEENKITKRRQKIYKAIFAIFIVFGFAIIVPIIGRCLADVIAFPLSSEIIYFIDNYWTQYSFVITLILYALIPFVLKERNQTFKEGLYSFFFKRPNKYMPSVMNVIIFIATVAFIYSGTIILMNSIGTTQLLVILSIGGASFLVYDAVSKRLKISRKSLKSILISLTVVMLLIVPSIFIATEAAKPVPRHLNINDVEDRYVTMVYHGIQDNSILLDYKSAGILRKNQLLPLPENRTLTIDSQAIKIINANPEGLDYEIVFPNDYPWFVFFIIYLGIIGFCCLVVGAIHIFEKIESINTSSNQRNNAHI